MKKTVLFIAALLFASANAKASNDDFLTIKSMLALCEEPRMSVGSGMCVGFLRGTLLQKTVTEVVSLTLVNKVLVSANLDIDAKEAVESAVGTAYGCFEEASGDQLVAVFVKWARANPERWHLPATIGVMQSSIAAFPPPCE